MSPDALTGFDWDAGNWPKCGKHGVSKEEIEAVFVNPLMVLQSPRRNGHEVRFSAVGLGDTGRRVFVVFTLRNIGKTKRVRPISHDTCMRKSINNMNEQSKKLKKFPVLLTDEEAERFVDEADLSEYDFSGFKPVQFEFLKKTARMEVRLPEAQLNAVKAAAKERGIPYTRLVRQFIDEGMRAL